MSKSKIQIQEPYPSQLDLIVADVMRELELASAKFPPFPTAHHGYAVIKEELDEMWDDIKKNNHHGMRSECVQVCAMALRFLMDTEE